jgi:hypothetical protein
VEVEVIAFCTFQKDCVVKGKWRDPGGVVRPASWFKVAFGISFKNNFFHPVI